MCNGTGEKLTVCVRTVNYSVKVLGHEELIGIPELTTLVMSEGEKQRCELATRWAEAACVPFQDLFGELHSWMDG